MSRLIVTGYTEAYIQFSNLPLRTVVRCTGNYHGRSWYDFVMVRKNDVILPGKVVGLIDVDEEIKFVIHSAIVEDGFDRVSTMQKSFFLHCPGDKDHIHLYDLGDIVIPLIVFPNYGRNQKTDFISMLPKRLWGNFFTEFINNSWL
jgi:hypothetical protein